MGKNLMYLSCGTFKQPWCPVLGRQPCYPQDELQAARQAGERLSPAVYHTVHLQQATWAAVVGEGTVVSSALTVS